MIYILDKNSHITIEIYHWQDKFFFICFPWETTVCIIDKKSLPEHLGIYNAYNQETIFKLSTGRKSLNMKQVLEEDTLVQPSNHLSCMSHDLRDEDSAFPIVYGSQVIHA